MKITRYSVLFAILLIAIAVSLVTTSCATSQQTDQQRLMNDAKSALVVSARIYDSAMQFIGDRYRAGACDESCKAASLKAADAYLIAARAMKTVIDSGSLNFSQHYDTLFYALQELIALVTQQGGALRTQGLPSPASLHSAITMPVPSSHEIQTWGVAAVQAPSVERSKP